MISSKKVIKIPSFGFIAIFYSVEKENLKYKIVYYRFMIYVCRYLKTSYSFPYILTLIFNLALIFFIKPFIDFTDSHFKVLFFILIGSGILFVCLCTYYTGVKLSKKIEYYKKKLDYIKSKRGNC